MGRVSGRRGSAATLNSKSAMAGCKVIPVGGPPSNPGHSRVLWTKPITFGLPPEEASV